MNLLALRLEIDGEELAPIPAPMGVIFIKNGEKVASVRIVPKPGFPFFKTKVIIDGEGTLKYFGRTIIQGRPELGIRKKWAPLTAELLELPPPLDLLPPAYVKPYEVMNPPRWEPW